MIENYTVTVTNYW